MTKLLAYDSIVDGDKITLMNSNGDGIESDDLLTLTKWLRFSKTNGALRVTWDIDDFISPLLKKFTVRLLEQLVKNDYSAYYDGDSLFYSLHRSFRHRNSYYYGLNRAFPRDTEVPASIIELQERADELTEALDLMGMGDFTKIASMISIFDQTELGRKTYEGIPRDYEIPQYVGGMLDYANQADRKIWVSNYQVGVWDSLFDWDVTSQYSSLASKLVHLHDLEYWKSDKMTSKEEGALFGFVKGRLYVDPTHEYQHCSPVMVKDIGNGKQGNPAGWLPEDCYSLDEIRFIENSGLGEFIMEDGYFAKVQNGVRPRFPLKSIMDYLYQHRGWSEMCSSVCKSIANQIVGKLIQTLPWKGGAEGEIYNSVYHSLIVCGGRVQVARWLLSNEVSKSQLVCVQTDGVKTTKDIPAPKTNGMGSWRCNGSYPCLVASPNLVLMEDRHPRHYTISMITEEIKAHPEQAYYGMVAPHRLTLGQAIEQGNISRVGETVELPVQLDLPAIRNQQTRSFSKLPLTGKQLVASKYYSEPIVMEV